MPRVKVPAAVPRFAARGVEVHLGDLLDVVPRLGRFDAVVTDPPYGLEFMGEDWDRGVPGERFWRAVLGATKPGGHLLIEVNGRGNVWTARGRKGEDPDPFVREGRFPANVAHDGSDEVLVGFPKCTDSGSAARFFYRAKVSRRERGPGNDHPTVKPLALIRWLLRLVVPPGGRVLDPFAGSGSTLLAARDLGLRAVGVELLSRYVEIAIRRLRTRTAR